MSRSEGEQQSEAGITTQPAQPDDPRQDGWLIVKRDLFYRPNSMGYTGIRDNAGRYTKAEADSHADQHSGVSIIHEDDAPEYTEACFPDLKLAHIQQKAAMLSAAPTISPRGSEEAERLRAKYGVAYSTALEHMNSTVSVGLGDLRVLLASLSPRGSETAMGNPITEQDQQVTSLSPRGRGSETGKETNQLMADLKLLQGTFKPGVIGHQIVSRALATLSSAPVSGGWQDIASAPKDRKIDLWVEWPAPERSSVRCPGSYWVEEQQDWMLDRGCMTHQYVCRPVPTHWRDAPPPPATGEVKT